MAKKPIVERRKSCPTFLAFTKNGEIKPVFCGLWSCPQCAINNARKWAWRVSIHIDASDSHAWFWTLTMSNKIKDRAYAYKLLPKLWDNLRKKMQRFYPDKWEYCAFVEGQPLRSNMPHFHVISMFKAPKKFKTMAVECGFGYQAKQKVVTSKKAAWYVAKYASKGDSNMPKNFRRVRASQTWSQLPEGGQQELLVKSRTETLGAFIMRVHDETNVPHELLLERWYSASDKFTPLQD